MAANFSDFHARLKNISRKTKALEGGYHPRVGKDGLVGLAPDKPAVARRLPLKSLLWVFGAFVGYKTFLLLNLGESVYSARLATLAEGDMVNQVGAKMM